ncbi:filamentous hemagglutinin [mine drainage metagenome]|uniref:Filamentous hemagglutinin n=1 Tax=mine drainage metagenome TaxID=410659 RepID=A0A1J5SMY6_9ZZZZ
MRTHDQANIEQNLNGNALVRQSPLRRTVAWLTLVAYIGQPMIVTAHVIADQAAAASKRPVIDTTANGIPLVQIATPNAAGVSHNQYTQFNVDPAGLILNNSSTTVLTQQAGYVAGNQNLTNGAASVILNEVTSTSRSQLNGYIEVAGQQAQVIVANPNGITCNGCGFINTSRGVLTTGTPVLGTSGGLDSLRVTGGDIQIGAAGLNAGNISQLDLIARSVQVNGQLWANNLNVVTGANLANYNNLGVQIIAGDANKPTVGIDVALLGGMYANKIRLVGTEAGVGVNSLGNLSAQAGDFSLDNQGQITLGGRTTANGNLTVNSNTGIANTGTLYSQQAAQLTSTGSITNSGLLTAQGNLTLNANSLNSTGILGAGIDANGNATQNGNLGITTQNQTVATGTNVAGSSMSIAATDINLANSKTSAGSNINLNATAGNIDLASAKTQSLAGSIVMNATGSVTNDLGTLNGVTISSTSAGFSNAGGNAYASGNLGLNSSGVITNSGALLALGNLTVNANSLNSTGILGAGIDANGNATQNGSLGITTQNQTVATGTNVAGGSMSIASTDISLANSKTSAGSDINLNASAGNIDLTSSKTQSVAGNIALNASGSVINDLGTLNGAKITSTSAGFSNTSGNVYASGDLGINSSGAISNSGALLAQGNFTLNANSLNSTGILGAGIDVNGNATQNGNLGVTTQNQTVATGTNVAGGSMSIAATDISLANSKTSAGSNINLNAGAGNIDLTSSKTQSVAGNIALTASGAVNNTSGLLFGTQVASNAASFNNTHGILGANGNISLTANNIDNTNGQIGNTLNSAGNITLTTPGNLTNTGGQIGSDQDLLITANTILGNGRVIGGRDANISLQGNYINASGNVFQANRDLTFGTTGTLTNQTSLEAVGNLTVNAAGIDNQAGAQINSDHTTLNTGTGDIANAGRIEGNIVDTYSNNFNNTATVIGNVVNINANNISNLNAAAIIAATQSVNLIVTRALVNQDGANIFSLGDINIGSNSVIDPMTGYVTGNAVSVTNRSATIDATNDLRISAATITNERTVVGLEWGPSWTGTPVVGTPGYNALGTPSYTPTYADQHLTAATTPAAQFLSGANMFFGGGVLNNTYSNVIAGGTLVAQMAVNNNGPALLESTTLSGQYNDYSVVYVPQSGTCGYFSYNCVPAHVAYIPVTTPYNPAPTYVPISGLNYTQLASSPYAYLAANGSQPVAINAATATANTTSAPTPGSNNVSSPQKTQPVAAVAGAASTNPALPALTVPTSGLYTIHSQPGQPYLVVTDPRFTSYANFVSSDYMLSRLSLNPQQMQMRLGDGFYEQQLVTQQITAGTGRMYVNGYTDAQSEFIALMNSGIDAAKDFNLTVGVALTTAQINSLKHDIVWMVDRSVTLPNGTTEHVLAPQVYLSSVQEADLKPSGALISANVININGNVNNSGTIRANTALSINANDITNQGGTISSGGSAILVASNDILNLSGNISGADVSLTAGRDITNALTSQNVTRTFGNGVMNGTELNSAAGINATGSLNMNAGKDVSIVGAAVNAGGDATINAGRNLTVGVLTATNSSTANQYGAYATNITQHTSSIQTGGNLNLASGSDMHLTSAALNVGKDATLMSGGDLTIDASKNSTSSGYNTGSAIGRFNDETVLGSTLNAGGNVTLVATQLNTAATTQASGGSSTGRTDGKGNITLQSTDITSKTGALTVAADANVNIGVTAENHNSYTESHATGSGLFTTTTLDVRSESWRTDNIGSNLSGNSVSITSGKNIGVVGSTASAMHDINVAAMGDVNITAATNTYGSDSYRHETTTGLQFSSGGNPFSLTDSGPDITTQARIDGTKQSYNRSSLTSTGGNINVVAGGNLVALGTDLAAKTGNLALTAGGTVALLAGQDTLNQSSSTLIVTNPNAFTKQHHTITDTSSSVDYQGSTAQANNINVNSGADTVLQAAQVTSGAGGINIDAAGDLKLLAATNSNSSTHTETLSTDGMGIKADGTPADLATRRINNKAESQTQTNQVTSLVSAGDITTHSGGDTLIQASTLNAQGAIALSATGYAATTNADGSTNAGRDGKITFAAVKDNTYTNVTNSNNSFAWQNANGGGNYVETPKLANISTGPSTGLRTGKGLSVNAKGGVAIDIPTVPATPASAPQTDAKGNIIPPVALTAEQQAAQRQADFNKAIQNLSSQPGQAWIGQLANDPKVQVQWNQVQTAAQHWNYAHDGLTQEAVVVIAIAVAYFTAGAGSSMVGTTSAVEGGAAGATATTIGGTTLATTATTAAGATVTEYTVAGAVINAGFTALASEAAVSFANNKGDIGKTLNDMGQSQNVRNVVAAMLTAGVGADYLKTYNLESFAAKTLTGCITSDMTGSGCQKGATTAAIMAGSEWANNAMRNSMIDDSKRFKGVKDANDPSGKIYNNVTGQGSAGINGSGDRLAGTRIDVGALGEFGTMTPPTVDNPLWTFSGKINPDNGKAFMLSEAIAAQTGLTGGSQALSQTFANISVAPGSFLDRLDESFAGPHDYFGGVVWNGYDALGNANVNQPSWIRNGMAIVDIPLVTPLVIPTFLQQINLDPVTLNNTVHNGTH